jgi:hypothetical protein
MGHHRRRGAPFTGLERKAEEPRAGAQERGIAREDEFAGPVGERRRKREVGPDARGLAARHDDAARRRRLARAQGFLTST